MSKGRDRRRGVTVSKKDRLDKIDQATFVRLREKLGDKYLIVAAAMLEKSFQQMGRVGAYHAALISGIAHDHYLKAVGKTPPGVTVLINIPGMQAMSLQTGQSEDATPHTDTSREITP